MSDLLAKCDVCGGLLDEEDLFCSNCGTSAPDPPHRLEELRPAATATHNFECAGCGASMSYSAETGTLRCPFCGSQKLERRNDQKVLAAHRAVPFRLSQQAASDSLRAFLGSSFWHPGDLGRAAQVTKMSAVYVPYWVFSGKTHTYWTADSGNTPFGARGDWVPLTGEHRGEYRGMLVGASGALAPSETEAICPFDLSAAATPDQVDFGDAAIEQFTVQRKFARPLARSGLEAAETESCARHYLTGRYRNLKVNVRIEQLQSEPVLLPVWIMAYRYKEQLYRFIVNGQTGKASGQAPFSKAKALLVAALVLIAILILLLVVGVANAGDKVLSDSV